MLTPLKFIPVYFERLWGGRELEKLLGRTIPRGFDIGESRELSDRPESVSVIAEGDFRHQNFRDALSLHGAQIMGPNWQPENRFPLLIKWLDCSSVSSIQVHPPKAAAARLGGEEKTEVWYFYHTKPGAKFFAGLHENCSAGTLREAVAAGTVEHCLKSHESRQDSCVVLSAGTLHAACGGNVILEIQQSSDTTYRLYDWNRRNAAGNLRKLQVENALASVDFEKNRDVKIVPVVAGTPDSAGTPFCNCEHFLLKKLVLRAGTPLNFAPREQPRVIVVLRGELVLLGDFSMKLSSTETALLPYESACEFVATRDSEIILIENFYVPAAKI